MYKACIFDLDGTLTDTLESLTYSVNATLEELGLEHITGDQCRRFVGDGAKKLVERALVAAGDPEMKMAEVAVDTYKRIFSKNCTYLVEPYDGIVDMIRELKSRDMKIAVFSNKPHLQTIDVVETVFGKGVFDHIQGQKDGFPRKPDPKGLFEILDRFQISPEEGIYVGDSEVDMKTGKSAGMLTIGVNWGFRSQKLLEDAGADATIDKAGELLKFI